MREPSRVERNGSLIIDIITNLLIITLVFINSSSNVLKFVAVLIPLLYYPVLHSIISRSIGDMIFGLEIVDPQGNKIGFRLAFKRYLYVFKYSVFILMFTNLFFLLFFSRSGNEIRDVSVDFQGESKTYLVKIN